MKTLKATVENIDDKRVIVIVYDDDTQVRIPICEDKPIMVKNAFNQLITLLKDGVFKIELENVEADLFSQVAKEYIKQLNTEISEVYGEMEEYNLVN